MGVAGAHQASDAFVEVGIGERTVEVRWWAALRDLETEIGLDQNGDGAITWGELAAREGELATRLPGWVRVSVDGAAWAGVAAPLMVDEREDGGYAVLGLTGPRPGDGARLAVEYGFLFATDPGHRAHLEFRQGGEGAKALLEPGSRTAGFTVRTGSVAARAVGAAGAALGQVLAPGPGLALGLAVPAAVARGGGRPMLAALPLAVGFWVGVLWALTGAVASRPAAEAWVLGLAGLGFVLEALRPRLGPGACLRLGAGAGLVWGIAAGPGLVALAAGSGPAWAGIGLGVTAALLGAGAAALRLAPADPRA
jgi:hypothetical protein